MLRGAPIRTRFYYGWVMLPAAALLAVCSTPGQSAGVSGFNAEFQATLGLSDTRLSTAYMLATLAASGLMTPIGTALDRHGPRRTLVPIAAGLALGCGVLAASGHVVVLAAGFFLVRLFGQGGLSIAAAHTLANWFDRRLGLAMGLSAVGFSLGIGFAQTLVNDLIGAIGWRPAQLTLGGGVLLVVALLAALIYRNYPADVGQQIEGGAADRRSAAPAGMTLREATRTPAYWAVAAVGGFWAAAGTAVIFFSETIALARGFGEDASGYLLMAFGLTLSALTFPAGLLADRLPLRALYLLGVTAAGAGLLALTLAATPAVLYASGVGFGLAQALLMAGGGVAVPRLFGRQFMGRIKGSLGSVSSAGSALGPFLVGTLRDLTGGYGLPLAALAAACVPLLGVAWLAGSTHRLSTDVSRPGTGCRSAAAVRQSGTAGP